MWTKKIAIVLQFCLYRNKHVPNVLGILITTDTACMEQAVFHWDNELNKVYGIRKLQEFWGIGLIMFVFVGLPSFNPV